MEAGVADREARELARRAVGVGAAVDEQGQQARREHVRVEGVAVLGDIAQQAAHLPRRYRGDTAEIQERYRGDIAEIQGRYSGDVGEK